ncbi:MAG: cation:dicarboxylase symporter family transporter, partial [Bryobacteraceae bacterium]|nr:cation:dicarboxylase symporter family transporter [Bryobacteraceae bacterium]
MDAKHTDVVGIPTRLIFLALVGGAAAGLTANALAGGHPRLLWIIRNVAEPVGQVWLRMLFMVVVPLIFSTMVLGVAQLGQLHRLGRILGKTLLLFLLGTALAATLGLALVNAVRPGAGLPQAVTEQVLAEYRGAAEKTVAGFTGFGLSTFVNIVPRNPVDAAARGDFLALIFFALVFGAALARVPAEKARPVSDLLAGVAEVMIRIIGFVMKLAPLGVGMLVFATASRFGLGLLRALGLYVLVVVAGALSILVLQSFIPSLKGIDRSIPLLLAALFFFAPGILDVQDLEKKIPWNIILLFSGAMSIGFALWQTGAAQWMAIKWLSLLQGAPWLFFVLGVAVLVSIMTNFIMNVAAIAITLPVALVIAQYL